MRKASYPAPSEVLAPSQVCEVRARDLLLPQPEISQTTIPRNGAASRCSVLQARSIGRRGTMSLAIMGRSASPPLSTCAAGTPW